MHTQWIKILILLFEICPQIVLGYSAPHSVDGAFYVRRVLSSTCNVSAPDLHMFVVSRTGLELENKLRP